MLSSVTESESDVNTSQLDALRPHNVAKNRFTHIVPRLSLCLSVCLSLCLLISFSVISHILLKCLIPAMPTVPTYPVCKRWCFISCSSLSVVTSMKLGQSYHLVDRQTDTHTRVITIPAPSQYRCTQVMTRYFLWLAVTFVYFVEMAKDVAIVTMECK